MFSHSMGARAVAAASDKLARFFEKLPEPSIPEPSVSSPSENPAETQAAATPATAKMYLKTMTFLSPDMDTGEFVGHCGPILRSLCPLITIYGDTSDSALDLAVFFNTLHFKYFPDAAPPGLKAETCAPVPLLLKLSIILRVEIELDHVRDISVNCSLTLCTSKKVSRFRASRIEG